jgi:hypothetical protein
MNSSVYMKRIDESTIGNRAGSMRRTRRMYSPEFNVMDLNGVLVKGRIRL